MGETSTSVFFVGVLPIAIGLGFLLFLLRSRAKTVPDRGTAIDIIVCARRAARMEPSSFARQFQSRWNKMVACSSMPAPEEVEGCASYLISSGKSQLRMDICPTPLNESFVQTMSAADNLSEDEVAALRDHQAYVSLFTMKTEATLVDTARFASMVLLTLMESEDMIGYTARSIYGYRTRAQVDFYRETTEIASAELFALLVNIHVVDHQPIGGAKFTWAHTHGMEQFGLPDIEIWSPDGEDMTPLWNMLLSSSMYTIESGATFSAGETCGFDDDGPTHKIIQPRKMHDHSYGAFGAVQIVPVSSS